MLITRIDKEPTDRARIVADLAWWLDEGETISEVLSGEVIQGMSGWSEAPYPPRDSPPPYDPTPLVMFSSTLDSLSTQLIAFVEFGTSGLAYTLQFVLLGTSQRKVTIELGVQVTGVPPERPMPLPPPPSEAAGSGPTAAYLNIKGGAMEGPLYLFHNPVYPTEAVTKHYVDGMSWVSGPYMPEAGGTFTGPVTMTDTLTLSGTDPLDPLGAVNKQYVDGQIAAVGISGALPLAGGRLTGPLYLDADPVDPLEATTKQYAEQYADGLFDTVADDYVPLSGTTMTGALVLSQDPTVDMGAATKLYVDNQTATGGYTLPPASTTVRGGLKVDGTTVTMAGDVLSAVASPVYTLPSATTTTRGGIRVDGTTVTMVGDVLSAVTPVLGFGGLPASVRQAPVAFSFAGKPTSGARVNIPIAMAVTVAAALNGTVAYATTAATADATFTANKISGGVTTALGTVAFHGGATAPTFAGSGGSLAAGDVFQMVAPVTQDATLADLGITIMCVRT